MQFKLVALLALAVASVNGAAHSKRSGTCACSTHHYTSAKTQAAISKARSGSYGGYPHQYYDYEGYNFMCSGSTYYEYPILSSGSTYGGGNAGPDRVVYDNYGSFCGCITHTGASGNNFMQCSS